MPRRAMFARFARHISILRLFFADTPPVAAMMSHYRYFRTAAMLRVAFAAYAAITLQFYALPSFFFAVIAATLPPYDALFFAI